MLGRNIDISQYFNVYVLEILMGPSGFWEEISFWVSSATVKYNWDTALFFMLSLLPCWLCFCSQNFFFLLLSPTCVFFLIPNSAAFFLPIPSTLTAHVFFPSCTLYNLPPHSPHGLTTSQFLSQTGLLHQLVGAMQPKMLPNSYSLCNIYSCLHTTFYLGRGKFKVLYFPIFWELWYSCTPCFIQSSSNLFNFDLFWMEKSREQFEMEKWEGCLNRIPSTSFPQQHSQMLPKHLLG